MERLQVISSYYSVGPPLFTYPQLVLLPGSTATINLSYAPYDGNDLHQLLSSGFGVGDQGPYYSVNYLDRFEMVDPVSTGVSFESSPIVYLSNVSAYQIINITIAPNAPSATYPIGWVGCPAELGCYLITVGPFPFWGPLRGELQVATLLICIGIPSVIVLALVTINFIYRRGLSP